MNERREFPQKHMVDLGLLQFIKCVLDTLMFSLSYTRKSRNFSGTIFLLESTEQSTGGKIA